MFMMHGHKSLKFENVLVVLNNFEPDSLSIPQSYRRMEDSIFLSLSRFIFEVRSKRDNCKDDTDKKKINTEFQLLLLMTQ